MIQYDETRLAMEALTPQIEELKGALNLEGLKIKVDELEMSRNSGTIQRRRRRFSSR